jgi:hypothetical protein
MNFHLTPNGSNSFIVKNLKYFILKSLQIFNWSSYLYFIEYHFFLNSPLKFDCIFHYSICLSQLFIISFLLFLLCLNLLLITLAFQFDIFNLSINPFPHFLYFTTTLTFFFFGIIFYYEYPLFFIVIIAINHLSWINSYIHYRNFFLKYWYFLFVKDIIY